MTGAADTATKTKDNATMTLKQNGGLSLAALAALAFAGAHPTAASTNIIVSTTAPTPGTSDIYQLSTAGDAAKPDNFNDYTDNARYNSGPIPGETFTTGSSSTTGYDLNSLTVAVGDAGNAGGATGTSFNLNLYSVTGGTASAPIYTQAFNSPGFVTGNYLTFNLASPVVLTPNTTYAYALGDNPSTSGLYAQFADTTSVSSSVGGNLAAIPSSGGTISLATTPTAYQTTFDLGLTAATPVHPGATTAIGINFGTTGSTATGNTADTLGPTATAGVVPVAHYNNETNTSGTSVPLLGSTGTPTGATLTYTSGTGTYHAAFGGGTVNPNNGDEVLNNGGIYASPKATVSGITYGSYNVYVYTELDHPSEFSVNLTQTSGTNETLYGTTPSPSAVFTGAGSGFN